VEQKKVTYSGEA